MEEIGLERLNLQSKDKYVKVKLTWALHMGIDIGLCESLAPGFVFWLHSGHMI